MPIDPKAAPDADYASYPSLAGRTVLVTGGADGIVEEFAKQGSRVAFIDIRVEKAAETIQRCEALGVDHSPVFVGANLLDIQKVQEAIAGVISDFGSIDVLVNNAANDDRHTWEDVTLIEGRHEVQMLGIHFW